VRGGGADLLYKEPRKIELRLTLTTGDVKQQVIEFWTMDKVQKPSINECYIKRFIACNFHRMLVGK
jgi:hypothetical protein